VKRDFENKLRALQVSMVVEVQAILAPFLAFTYSYNVNKAHNMLALILDLWFKSLNAVKAFVG
jgi:hypothetical protein